MWVRWLRGIMSRATSLVWVEPLLVITLDDGCVALRRLRFRG